MLKANHQMTLLKALEVKPVAYALNLCCYCVNSNNLIIIKS